MSIVPLVITAIVFTIAYHNNKEKIPLITPAKTSKVSFEGYSAKGDEVYSSKDAKAVIEDFPYPDFMDRPYLPPWLPPPVIVCPTCVTNVNPRGYPQ